MRHYLQVADFIQACISTSGLIKRQQPKQKYGKQEYEIRGTIDGSEQMERATLLIQPLVGYVIPSLLWTPQLHDKTRAKREISCRLYTRARFTPNASYGCNHPARPASPAEVDYRKPSCLGVSYPDSALLKE
jgi:hypothetical protein